MLEGLVRERERSGALGGGSKRERLGLWGVVKSKPNFHLSIGLWPVTKGF